MDRLTQIGNELVLLLRREVIARGELEFVERRMGELRDEVRRSTTGQLYRTMSDQAAIMEDPAPAGPVRPEWLK